MTLNQFLDIAYATLVDEYRRLGSGLVEALDRTREYAAGGHKLLMAPVTASGKTEVRAVPEPRLTPEERQNEQAMAMFEQMMGGVDFK